MRVTRAALALLVLACAAAPAVAAAPPSPPPPPARVTPEQAQAMLREISAKVEKIRGLTFKTPVEMKIIGSKEARANLFGKVDKADEEAALHTQNAYLHMGLIPPGTNLLKSYVDLTEKDLQGYYEHGTRVFYLLDHVDADEVRGVMAHELTHALEDQHYDLASVVKKAEGNPDYSTAIRAVVEGSATAVQLAFLGREEGEKEAAERLRKTEGKRAERLRIAPSFTQRRLLLPYLLGFTFLLQGKPWEFYLGGGVYRSDIDAAYQNPPFSTRQILHPEQYWHGRKRYQHLRLTLPDLSTALGPGWTRATEGSVGELGLAVLTGSREGIDIAWALLPSRWTNAAATGVLGDAYHHYVNGDRKVTVLLTRWDTERDADQFDQALLDKGRHFFRYGLHVGTIAGDIGDRAQPVAIAALQGAKFWE
jgi:hypothetical protein